MIPLSVPVLRGNEENYVMDALKNGWVSTGGSYVKRFEQEMSSYLRTADACAVQSGTAALHLALRLSGVEAKDEVLVPTLTFIAAVNPVRYVGAEPIFMDCDEFLGLDCEKVENFLKTECELTKLGTRNKKSGRYIKAMIVVHIFGNLANIHELKKLVEQYQLTLIEDATEALGTYAYGQPKQFAGTMGDFGAYSFNGNKIITTGGGGMLVAKDAKLLQRARYLSTQAKDDPITYEHHEIGYNYRMTNLQAALGVAQLEELEGFIEDKKNIYQTYQEEFKEEENAYLLPFNKEARNNHWLTTLYIKRKDVTKESFIEWCKEHSIETRPIWKLNHTQKMYQQSQSYYIERAVQYWEHCINLPSSANLREEEIHSVSKICKQLLH